MKERLSKVLTVLLVLASMALFAKAAVAGEVSGMTKEELRTMLGNPDVIILDVRSEKQWTASPKKIPGAVYEDHTAVTSWSHKYLKDKTIVTY
ncbi:MAG: hypothetical protein KAV87_38720 [Desulfobacteraceae bacterium]|nr:hypothetical protein [Desulfobacteraceae bacterium]